MSSINIYKPRWIVDKIRVAAEFSPVIILSGPRQTGKSTILQNEPPFKNWHYITFDDLDYLALAQKRPNELLAISHNMVIDEVQKAPAFLHSVKKAVDQDRTRRLALSGSAKLLLMENVSESLAGRAVYFDLMPFSYGELMERQYGSWLGSFLKTGRLPSLNILDYTGGQSPGDLTHTLFRGFMPPVALMEKEEHISTWWKGYIATYLGRDLRELAQISYLTDFKKIMTLIALRTANILNQTGIARDIGLSSATAARYINLLEETGLVMRLSPYSKNISKRLIKSPKIFMVDTGLATALAGYKTASSMSEEFKGTLFESYVFLNLKVIAELMEAEVMYFRTQGGREKEVDFILEKENEIIGIEVKSSSTVSVRDMEGLLFLKDATERFAGGLIVYCGHKIRQLGMNIFAIPWYLF